jgi:predicted nucleotidyltransferase
MTEDFNTLIHKAADVLRSFGATDVYLFGSVAQGTNNEHSDIDFAVSGLPPKVFFKAMSCTIDVLKQEFDLIDLDEKNPFVDYLKANGELLRVI